MSNRLWLSGVEKDSEKGAAKEGQPLPGLREDMLHMGSGGRSYSKGSDPVPEGIRLRNEADAEARRSVEGRISDMLEKGDTEGAEKLSAALKDADEWDFEVL